MGKIPENPWGITDASAEATDRSLRDLNRRQPVTLGHVIDLLESLVKHEYLMDVARDLRERWRV